MGVRNMFTAKQTEVWHQVIDNDKWTLMINSGAVRAGKTYVDNFIFLHELRRASALAKSKGEVGQFILAGADSGSIQSNILFELSNLGVDYRFDKNNFIHFNDKIFRNIIVKQAYTGTIAGLQHIRGMTAYGAYVNEATMANKAVFDEIRNRCSIKGARVVCDTNPDVPTHYIKKLIDKAETSEFVVANNFTIDDNAENLDPDYIQSLKETTPSGMFYDRKILGKWAMAEGVIYKDFSPKENVVKASDIPKSLEYFCGVDWGYSHYGVITLLGYDHDTGIYYLINEYSFQYVEIDEWVGIAHAIQDRYGDITFYCDSARPEHVYRFIDEDIHAVNANKSVLDRIEVVSGLIKNRKLLFSDDEYSTTENHVKYNDEKYTVYNELYEYVWQEGVDKPVKLHDDRLDSLGYAIYNFDKEQRTSVESFQL